MCDHVVRVRYSRQNDMLIHQPSCICGEQGDPMPNKIAALAWFTKHVAETAGWWTRLDVDSTTADAAERQALSHRVWWTFVARTARSTGAAE